jgi:HD-GYP domain-containing protein (c-di-GMP phosphodiesterase class II)
MGIEEIIDEGTLIKSIHLIETSKGNNLSLSGIKYKIDQLKVIKEDADKRLEKEGYKDSEHGHGAYAVKYSDNICKALNIPDNERYVIDFSTEWHDIGKSLIPSNILYKIDKFSPKEWEIIKMHSVYGEELIKPLYYPAKIVRYHHSGINETGYPKLLENDEVPKGSKIIAVADAYETMTSKKPRSYKKIAPIEEIRNAQDKNLFILPPEMAIEVLQKGSGIRYDKEVVNYLIKVLHKLGELK